MVSVSLSDVTKAASLAWEVYQLGWSDELRADRHFREFGDDIKSLAKNLGDVRDIVQNARALRSRQHLGASAEKEWELSSIQEIVGDYNSTLADCKKLIEENSEFRTNRGARYNLEWNLVIRPKVEQLQKRLNSHNTKILLLLKPLELSLLSDVYRGLSDVHHDLAERINTVHQSVLHLQGLLIPDMAQAISEQGQQMEISIRIPEHVETKFLAAAEKSHLEVRHPNRFPLKLGADAFLAHFEKSTKNFEAGRFLTERTPAPEQYLNLLKCIWILRRIQSSEAFAQVSQPAKESQWPWYINQLHEDLYAECQRFSARSAQKLLAPDMQVAFEESKFEIWIEEDLTSYFSPHVEKVLPPILEIPLSTPSETLRRHLSICPVNQTFNQTRYKLIETIHDINSPAKHTPPLEIDIDLEKFSFTPLYAIPSSKPRALEVMLDGGSNRTTPEFQDIKHIYRLQHLLTGYKVYDRYDQEMVKVSFIIPGENNPIEEHGRVQLWLPQPFTASSPETSHATLESTAVEGTGQLSSHPSRHKPSQSSRLTQGSGTTSVSARSTRPQLSVTNASSNTAPIPLGGPRALANINRRPVPSPITSSPGTLHSGSTTLKSPTLSGTRSSITALTSVSAMSRNTGTTVTTINTGSSSRARLHAKPMKPMLVIFLKSKEPPVKLSVVAIQIDDTTNVERERCDCRSSNSQCRISCLERTDGYLLAQRWEADNSLSNFNIAKLGMEQRKDSENRWGKVKRVSLKFDKWEHRYCFAGSPCSCRIMTSHDLSRCNIQSHNGLFGIIKQIGTQRLQNYRNERDRATSIVIGRLPGDDIAS